MSSTFVNAKFHFKILIAFLMTNEYFTCGFDVIQSINPETFFNYFLDFCIV